MGLGVDKGERVNDRGLFMHVQTKASKAQRSVVGPI